MKKATYYKYNKKSTPIHLNNSGIKNNQKSLFLNAYSNDPHGGLDPHSSGMLDPLLLVPQLPALPVPPRWAQHLLLGQYRITGAEYWSCWEGVNMPSTQHTLYEVRKGKLTNK